MKKNCYLFVFDGFADWETSYVSVGISLSESYRIRTLALEKGVIRSMGGLSVAPEFDFLPEVDLDDIHPSNTGLVILPGGSAWERRQNDAIAPLVYHCVENKIPVAAICGATVLLADMGLLDNVHHTSNSMEYLRRFSQAYDGADFYRDYPSIRGGDLITAGGAYPVELAREVIDVLGMGAEDRVRSWFQHMERVTS